MHVLFCHIANGFFHWMISYAQFGECERLENGETRTYHVCIWFKLFSHLANDFIHVRSIEWTIHLFPFFSFISNNKNLHAIWVIACLLCKIGYAFTSNPFQIRERKKRCFTKSTWNRFRLFQMSAIAQSNVQSTIISRQQKKNQLIHVIMNLYILFAVFIASKWVNNTFRCKYMDISSSWNNNGNKNLCNE